MEAQWERDIFPNEPNSTSILSWSENLTSSTKNVQRTIANAHSVPMDWVDYTEFTCLIMLVLVGAPGNGLIILVQTKIVNKISTDYLVAGLALADMFDATVNTTFNMLFSGYKLTIFSSMFCGVMAFAAYWTGVTSATFIGALALDRYILTCKPFSRWYNQRVAKFLCGLIPLCTGVLTIPYLFLMRQIPGEMECIFPANWETLNVVLENGMLLFVIIDFITVITCYSNIAFMLRKRKMRHNKRSSEVRKQAATLSYISTDSFTGNNCQTTDTTCSDTTEYETAKVLNVIKSTAFRSGDRTKFDYAVGNTAETNNSTTDRTVMSTITTDKTEKDEPNHLSRKKKNEEQIMNKTTVILFLISLIFMISWSFGVAVIMTRNRLGRVLGQLLYLGRKINIVTNIVLFMLLSSKFRTTAKKIICGTCERATQTS